MINRDHYTMDHFDVLLGTNNNANMLGTHHPHFDHYGSWNFLHGKMHSLIDVVQPATGLSANVDFRYKDEDLPCPCGKPPTHLEPIKIYQGENAEAVWKLRNDVPYLSKLEIKDYRNAFFQNMCLCMLSLGYHRAFSELFHLIDKEELERQVAGPESILWNMTPISMQEDKLTLLKDCLSTCEDHCRKQDFVQLYNGYSRLANFFKQYPEDKWVVIHFLKMCWSVSKNINKDRGLSHAESNYYLGLALHEDKEYEEAFKYLYNLYLLSNSQSWRNENNVPLFVEACEHLAIIRMTMASILVESFRSVELSKKIRYLREALKFAGDGRKKKLEAECCHKIGLAYQELEKMDVALDYLNNYYRISKSLNDFLSLCQACEALASLYKSQKKYEQSIKFLEQCIEFAEIAQLKEVQSRVCRTLGDLYNQLGEFTKAMVYFSRSFGISKETKSGSAIDGARILFGVSQGNYLNFTFKDHIQTSTRLAINRLINWKILCKEDLSEIGKPIYDKKSEKLILLLQ